MSNQQQAKGAPKGKAKSKGKSKSKSLNAATYTPIASLLGIAAVEARAAPSTLVMNALKAKPGGGFKVSGSTTFSGLNANRVPDAPKGTIIDLLQAWNGVAKGNGWDQGYVDSFIQNEELPPTHDPEIQSRSKEPGDSAIHEWTRHIDTFVQHMITSEGRGRNPPSHCQRCRKSHLSSNCYRCLSCTSMGLVCRDCMLATHADSPLHRVQVWNGTFFAKTTLKAMGLRIQLGHFTGEKCGSPQPAIADDFVILDVDAVHSVALDFCGCGLTNQDHVAQLMERRLWPATVTQPKTAATFRLLEHFEILQYESKLSLFEVWATISRLTDNTGLNPPKDRYPSLIRMVHEFRQVRMLKRAGRGHDPERPPSETREGECALLCPCCPHPGINMPEGWEKEPPERMYIHALNIGLDANFRLKRKDVSSDQADPGLSRGWSYFVENLGFRKFLKPLEDDTEPKSTCSRHDAVNLADTRPGQGYQATGVGTVECTRHNMKRPSAVGDLQRGERYCNMDYILFKSLAGIPLRMFIISYDIACQWSLKLFEHLSVYAPDCPLLSPGCVTRFVVPKFHLPAHIPLCRSRFAFMLTPGAGLGDGEAPERGWGEANPLGPSTREMGPGTRRDTLDFNFSDYNWRKYMNLGSSLLKKMTTAINGVVEHVLAHRELHKSVEEEHDVEAWEKAVTEWEADRSQPNPFELTVDTPTQDAVRRQLADEEKEAQEKGESLSMTDEISPGALIAWGIDLEAEQRNVKTLSNRIWEHAKDRQISRTQFRTNTLVRKIETWYRLLQLYIPGTVMLRSRDSGKAKSAFDLPLYLPSGVGSKVPVDVNLAKIEYRLRFAQAHEALGTVRRNLQIRATLYDVKDRWLRGQGSNTRALNAIATVQARIHAAHQEYNAARSAVIVLTKMAGEPNTSHIFLPLEKDDLRSMTEADSLPTGDGSGASRGAPPKRARGGKARGRGASNAPGPRGETKRKLSWIWRAVGSSQDMQAEFAVDTMRVEWGKSRARAQRYQEEIQIVKEEMSRTLRFFSYKALEWESRAKDWNGRDIDPAYAEGLNAYAYRQASISRSLRESYAHQWRGVDAMIRTVEEEIANPDLHYRRKGLSEETTDVNALAASVVNPVDDIC